MLLAYNDYRQIIISIVDIALVFFLIYQFYLLIKNTSSVKVFYGFVLLFLFWKLVTWLDLKIFSEILGQFFSFGIIILAIVFQQEIRRFLIRLSEQSLERSHWFRFFIAGKKEPLLKMPLPAVFTEAIRNMQKNRTGCLIIFEREDPLAGFILNGHIIDARINSLLLENIFFKNSPLHDGAVLIRNNRIYAAGCVVKISEQLSLPDEYGLRHRAAVAITMDTDAIAIVVSEETGKVSLCKRGELLSNISLDQLEQYFSS